MIHNLIPLASIILLFGFVPALELGPKLIRAFREHPHKDPNLQAALTEAEAHATHLEQRIEQLERILDEDIPGWRVRSSR